MAEVPSFEARVPRTELGRYLADMQVDVVDAPSADAWTAAAEAVEQFLAGWTADELDILGAVAERLNRGRQTYGPMDLASSEHTGADMLRDEAEELEDAAVYALMRRAARLRREAGQ